MVVKYNFKLLDNNGTFIEYKDKTTNQMLKIINKHLEEKFNVDDDLLITRDMINNLMNNKSSSKYLKIFIKNIVKKKLDKDGNVLETTTAN
jgi:hypothetical protein